MAKVSKQSASTPIFLISTKKWKEWLARQDEQSKSWIAKIGFKGDAGAHCIVPGKNQHSFVVACVSESMDIWSIAGLPTVLPAGDYHIETSVNAKIATALVIGWQLGSYRFGRYKKSQKPLATLRPPSACDAKLANIMAGAINHARDLINTPANDMGPVELAAACKAVARKCNAEYSEIVGENLVKENYPAVYAVGKASSRAPRLVDIRWGNKRHPKVTLVGKGVCFDSGGLDIKPSAGMKLMKKDMAGAASLLALAEMIMQTGLPVRLRVLIPAVENSISGNAYRPMDVLQTRKGITVEVGNTDAEGRLILCDALFEADEEKPDLLIDCATLTGAARTALGTDVPALFTPNDQLADDLLRYSKKENDPLWRLPLWEGYREMLNSSVADINSAPDGPYAGAITAALYLKEFVTKTTNWVHIDMMAWNLTKRPGRPVGAEAMAIRALYAFISGRFH